VNEPADFFDTDAPSFAPLAVPTVLVVGGPDALVASARRVATWEGSGIAVEACEPGNARVAALRARPFALVLSQERYGFDPDAIEALARELQAELVVLKVMRVSAGFLEQALRPALRHALRRYRSTVASGPVRK
jgi:ABC-type amino acid transport substrate-binding protein